VDDPRPATGASLDELLELVHGVRQELLLREEAPTGDWVERSAIALRSGEQLGWFYPLASGGGLAFFSTREAEAFGHVHVGAGPAPAERARHLADRLLDGLPASIRTVAVGFTGLAVEDERSVLAALADRPGSTVIERRAMERSLTAEDERSAGPAPSDLKFVPIRSVTLDALADLDVRAFAGSTDALLIGNDVAHYRFVLETILDGRLGSFLDRASTGLYRPDPPRLVAALLSVEQSARRAVFVDFMVDPGERRRGYGAFLLRWGFRALRSLGYERVRLWVSVTNLAACRLYEANGFRTTASTAIYRWERGDPPAQAQSGR
jgi:ribosomal protein S18 acetylase RimI-like enzyme